MASSESSVFQNAVEGPKLVTSASKFALNLYKEQAATNAGGNIFVSPISISIAMAMTYLGARGETMAQMKTGMFFGDVNDSDFNEAFSDVRRALNSPDDAYKLLIANKLFGEKTFHIETDYLASSEKFYGAELEAVDFMNSGSAAVATINSWVAENTNQKIKDILSSGDVTPLTRLILVNAIYFKGDWARKFNANDTTNEDFHVSATETVKVPLMSMKKVKVGYGSNQKLNCQAIELPYVKNALSLFVILPDHTVTDIHAVEQSLTVEDLANITDSFRMRESEVNIWLPRFKIDEKMHLNGLLQKMGIVNLFSDGKADLSGISKDGQLYVSKVLHQAYIEVNEEGSEAAAATAVIMMMRCMPRPPFDFRADHPFLFLIRDNVTKSILFFGRLSKP